MLSAMPLILLCNPPSLPGHIADREAHYGMGGWRDIESNLPPPLLLASCGAILRQAGWGVKGIDAVATRLDITETLNRILRCQPDVAVVAVSPTTAQADLKFVRALRARQPELPLVLVGLATRYLPKELVAAAHLTLEGEPEGVLHRACRHLLENPGAAPGRTTPQSLEAKGYDAQGRLLDLALLLPPAWGLFPVTRYAYLPLIASRGCGHGCRYCPAPILQGGRTRYRPVAALVEEMEQLTAWYRATHAYFLDPLFASDRAQVEALCAALIQRELPARLSWRCETRPDLLDLPLLQQMKQAGCYAIDLGLESISPEVLLATRRLPDAPAVQRYLTHLRQLIFGCRAFEIECHLHVMAGLPGDRGASAATRTFLRAYGSSFIHVHPLTPFPGTSIFPTIRTDEEYELLSLLATQSLQLQQATARQWEQPLFASQPEGLLSH